MKKELKCYIWVVDEGESKLLDFKQYVLYSDAKVKGLVTEDKKKFSFITTDKKITKKILKGMKK